MSTYKEYTFTTDTDTVRSYKGTRLNPVEGLKLGFELAKIISFPISQVDFSKWETEKVSVIFSIITSIDFDQLMALFQKVVTTSGHLLAKSNDTEAKVICPRQDKNFQEWFEKYPEDLFSVVVQVLYLNASPFLPPQIKEVLEPKSGEKVLENLLREVLTA